MRTTRLQPLLGFCLLLGGVTPVANAAAPASPQGVITAKEFLNIGGGTAIPDLTNNAKFPNSPDVVEYSPRFEWPTGPDDFTPPGPDIKNNYGVQIIGYFYPATTGPHTFYIAADDNAVLYLSTDSSPANKRLIAREPQWNPVRDFLGTARRDAINPENSSASFQGTQWPGGPGAPINLTQGQAYFIEALMKEGGGGDNLAVSLDASVPIPGSQLASIDKNSGPVTFTIHPQNQTVQEGTPATFTVEADGTPPYSFQWTKNGTDILDATNKTYTIAAAPLSDNGAQFRCRVTGTVGAPATSNPGTLTVSNDTTPPTIVRVTGSGTFNSATVVFSEPVTAASAGTLANYSFAGLSISAATVVSPTTVRLTTGTQTEGQSYTLTVNNIRDASVAGNMIAPNSQATLRAFVFSRGFATWERWQDQGDTGLIDTFTNNLADPLFRGPDVVGTSIYLGSPRGISDNYGLRAFTWFTPPQTGSYVFFLACDDQGYLFLSTDADPANRKRIAAQPQWSNQNEWNDPDLISTDEVRSDRYTASDWPTPNVINLTTGNRYYIELNFREGGGGDGSEVFYKLAADPDPNNGTAPNTRGNVIGVFADPTGASINITQQPQSATVLENATATFTVAATGSVATLLYQWQKAPAAGTFSDIAGANSATYTTPPLPMSENGSRYRVAVTVPGLTTNSAEAVVTVLTDTVPPTLASARRTFTNNVTVLVVFSEIMQAASANVAANYTINNGITVSAAALQVDGKTVALTTSPIASGTSNTLTVNAVRDAVGNQIAANSQVVIGFERGALYVHANAGPNASDNIIIGRLQSQGYYVELTGSAASDTTMGTGKNLIITSSTVPSGDVTIKFKDSAVPVINWEQALQDDYRMTDEFLTTDRGTTGGQTSIEIVDATHPMAAGLPAGILPVVTATAEFVWGQPNANAKIIARLVGSGNPTIYGYDKGALLTDGTPAPDRRVLFLMTDNTAAVLNADGFKLFDAAVNWAQNITVTLPPQITSAALAGGNITIQWTGGGTLQSTLSLSPPITWTDIDSSGSVTQPASGNKFYRVSR